MIKGVFNNYQNFRGNYPDRYFPPETVEKIIFRKNYLYKIAGYSVENRAVYCLTAGSGQVYLLFWAQMHGNETTASRAMFDFWEFLHSGHPLAEEWLKYFTIDFIPQLNPDGAVHYTRRNALNIDINRDFLANQSPEIQILKNIVFSKDYKILFNLHDQRSIFHPKNSDKPATLSFLSPSTGQERQFTDCRLKSARLISCIIKDLLPFLPDQISRFSDEYYPNATGDNFQRAGIPTILLECGHFPKDYKRNETRKFTFYSILSALNAIITGASESTEIDVYLNTPINDNKAFDIIYKGVKVQKNDFFAEIDLALQFEEILNESTHEIEWLAKIADIGDLSKNVGHDIYYAENRLFSNNLNGIPKIGQTADFYLGDWKILNGKILKDVHN